MAVPAPAQAAAPILPRQVDSVEPVNQVTGHGCTAAEPQGVYLMHATLK